MAATVFFSTTDGLFVSGTRLRWGMYTKADPQAARKNNGRVIHIQRVDGCPS